ncbi:hypothetical protein CJP74_06985 [Psittacicella melopsittaci]|uniref:Major facilitator superfamily (MFS) profile domain-containing protein n=1 Tax=Psittacicella melopsittaci TaxID=2028576 RepID=A0A3A1Y2Q8_9GAMM|nr:MFS transporter [Psittacicella melopsittaci]RIY31569.1 hypothetical protein CJP74_06985 [Psittacicella melopsittaci]
MSQDNNLPQGTPSTTYRGFDAVTPYQIELRKRLPPTVWLVLILAFFSGYVGLANDAITPAINELVKDFHTDTAHIQAIVPYFVLGMGIGQFLWGPTIDRFGRKTIVILCALVAIALNISMLVIHEYSTLIAVRIFQGIVFSGMGAVPQIVLKDVFSPRDFVIYNSWLMTLFLFAPAIAPLFGGIVLVKMSWPWIYVIISVMIVISTLCYIFFIPETLDPEKKQPFNTVRILKNYGTILRSPRSLWLIILNSVFSITVFSFPTLLPAIYITDYGVDPDHFGYFFLPLIVSIMVGIQLNQIFVKKGYSPVKLWIFGAIAQGLTTIVNFIFAYYYLNVHSILIALCLNVVFNGFQLGNMFAIYLMPYPYMTGTATSMITSLRLIVAGVLVTVFSHLDRAGGATLLITNAFVLLICTAMSLIFNWIWKVDDGDRHLATTSKPEVIIKGENPNAPSSDASKN